MSERVNQLFWSREIDSFDMRRAIIIDKIGLIYFILFLEFNLNFFFSFLKKCLNIKKDSVCY